MKNRLQKIVRSELVVNSAKLLSANVIAQGIGLIVYPILTRIYSPEDFGLLNLFLSIGGVLVLLSTAEYQYAIVLPKEEEKAIACFHVGFFFLLVTTLLCFISALFSTQIAQLFNTPVLADYYPLMCIFVFGSGLWVLLNYWYTRKEQFGKISAYQLTQSSTTAGLKYIFQKAGLSGGGLIFASISGLFIALITISARHFKRDIVPLFKVNRKACRVAAQQYANFPLFSLPKSIINSISCNLPVLLLTPIFGLTEIGYFGMALTLSFAPISLINKSLYQVLYQRTATHVHQGKTIKSFFHRFIWGILPVSLFCFSVLYFILPQITQWLLGDNWFVTGEYIRLLLPWLLLSVVVVPLGPLTDIFMKQKWWLYFEITMIVLRLIAIGLGIYLHNITAAIIGYSIASAVGLAIQLPWYLRLINDYEKHIA